MHVLRGQKHSSLRQSYAITFEESQSFGQVLILTLFIGCEVLGVSHGVGSLMYTYSKRKEFFYPS